jgi:hypothetical protein
MIEASLFLPRYGCVFIANAPDETAPRVSIGALASAVTRPNR